MEGVASSNGDVVASHAKKESVEELAARSGVSNAIVADDADEEEEEEDDDDDDDDDDDGEARGEVERFCNTDDNVASLIILHEARSASFMPLI